MSKEISKGPINVGDKFNMLTAISFVNENIKRVACIRNKSGFTSKREKLWLFKCDCGKEVITDVSTVKQGKRKSCGCKKTALTIERNKEGRLKYGEASRRNLLNKYIYSARNRNLSFDLSEPEFTYLVKQNCFYCGVGPCGLIKAEGKYGEYMYNGIDRIDSNIGYTFDNSVTCCKFCNMAKREYPVKEFLDWIQRLRDGAGNI